MCAETLKRRSANALVHRWSVAESLKHSPQLPRTRRGSQNLRRELRLWMTDCNYSAEQITRNIVEYHLGAREGPSRANSNSSFESTLKIKQSLSFSVHHIQMRIVNHAKKCIFHWARYYTEHQRSLRWANSLAMLAPSPRHSSANEKCKWRYGVRTNVALEEPRWVWTRWYKKSRS